MEIKHTSRLSVFEPFVMASQVKQVYYVPYACKNKSDLADWWVAYQVSPRGSVHSNDSNDDSNSPDGANEEVEFYQETRLLGTFVIDLGIDLENITSTVSDEITNPKDLEFLSKLNVEAEGEDMDDEETYEEDELNKRIKMNIHLIIQMIFDHPFIYVIVPPTLLSTPLVMTRTQTRVVLNESIFTCDNSIL